MEKAKIMGSRQMQELGCATTDYADRLLIADGRLERLNEDCGGRVGATLAIPELLDIVVKAREYEQCLSRQFTAIEGQERVSAWVEVEPKGGRETGCSIRVLAWHSETGLESAGRDKERHRGELLRLLSDLSLRIDQSDRILSLVRASSELEEVEEAVGANVGQKWTRIFSFPDTAAGQTGSGETPKPLICSFSPTGQELTAFVENFERREGDGALSAIHFFAKRAPLSQSQTPTGTPSIGGDLASVLRQPINRIIANAETIRTQLAGPIGAQYSDYAADIASAGQHLLALMDDLSDLAVVEADNFSTAPDRIDLGDVARRACGILRVRARERNIELDPPPAGESQPAIAEFRRVLQVLLNLIGNAIRYAPEESRIWVRLDASGGMAMVTVADQGLGLNAEEQVRIFEKYERLGEGEDGGTGLGLYISRRIARAMGGDLTVESAPGQGARFCLAVPIAN